MALLERVAALVRANLNDLIDKAEDPERMIKQVILKRGYKDGYAGWLAGASSAAGALMKHAMLLELSRSGGEPPPRPPNAG